MTLDEEFDNHFKQQNVADYHNNPEVIVVQK